MPENKVKAWQIYKTTVRFDEYGLVGRALPSALQGWMSDSGPISNR